MVVHVEAWGHVGLSSGHFGVMLGPSWGHLGGMLRTCSGHVEKIAQKHGKRQCFFRTEATKHRKLKGGRGQSMHSCGTVLGPFGAKEGLCGGNMLAKVDKS